MNISSLLKFLEGNSISKDAFMDGFKTVQEEGNYNSDSIFSENYTQKEMQSIFEKFDVNKDGTIDTADKLNGKSISEELMSEKDLKLLVNEFNNMVAEGLLGANNTIQTNPFSSSGGGGTYNPGTSGGGDTPDVPKTEDYSSMTASELRSKLSDAQGTLSNNEDALNKIINGSDSTLAGLKDNIDKAEEKYQETLKTVAPELAEKYQKAKEDLDTHNKAIADKNVEINETQSDIDSLTSSIANLDSNIAAYDAAIADLQAAQGDENAPEDLGSKIAAAQSQKENAEKQKAELEQKLQEANEKLTKLKGELSELEGQTAEKEQAVQTVQEEIDKLDNNELKNLKSEVDNAQKAYDTKQTEMKAEAEKAVATSKTELDKIQNALNAKQAEDIKKEYSVLDPKNAEKIYETLGLEQQGLNKEVFMLAMEGYNNLEDKGNGLLGIFDTTQSADKERYYLLDLNNFELVGRSVLKTGSGNMNNIKTANQDGSHATLSGFEKVGDQYYSDSMGKDAMRLIGLESGINDNALAKGTVVHYTTNNSTWGCKGFTPVIKNGRVDIAATNEKMHKLFPTGTIIFTNPTDSRYREYSALV